MLLLPSGSATTVVYDEKSWHVGVVVWTRSKTTTLSAIYRFTLPPSDAPGGEGRSMPQINGNYNDSQPDSAASFYSWYSTHVVTLVQTISLLVAAILLA